jgi:penicillin V acylase-like amidase (Ntn superfamily)
MKHWILIGLLALGLRALHESAQACAMFTMVSGDTVLMGNNEDFIKPGYVWFVPADDGRLGRVNFGFSDKFAQGSMNEKGLCFDAAVVTEVPWEPDPEKENVDKGTKNLLEHIMNTCGTVEEAIALFETYNCAHLASSQFMLADATGASAVVTWLPDTGLSVVERTGDYLINTNTRLEASQFRCKRYVLAERKLASATAPSVEVARDALDTIHQEGEGAFTSYSNVYDLKNRLSHVYNLANYDEVVTFDLTAELAKGPHRVALKKLFRNSPKLSALRKANRRSYETAIALPTNSLARFSGKYSVMDGKTSVGIKVEGDILRLVPPDGKAAHLFPESETKFRIREGGQLTFTLSPDGEVTGFVLHRNGDHVGSKLPE